MTAKKNSSSIPVSVWITAHAQWIPLLCIKIILAIVGVILSPIIIGLGKKFPTNVFGEGPAKFDKTKYPNASDEGWEFLSIDPKYKKGNSVQRFIWQFGNDEDGFLGDIRGKWSDIVNGDERSWTNKFKWAILRNPVNNLRFTEKYSCDVNECDIEYWGDYKYENGSFMTKAVDRRNGHVYYGYRNKSGATMGFKVYPEHAEEIQPDDNKDRGFTYRPI